MTDDIEAYREAIEWVRNVHPGALENHVVIAVTWDEWNAMRALLDLPKQVFCPTKREDAV